MVEFLSTESAMSTPVVEIEGNFFSQDLDDLQESAPLEALVEEKREEREELPAIVEDEPVYVDEPAQEREYVQPVETTAQAVDYREELNPSAYEDNEVQVIVDLFDKYSKNPENKWWLKKTQY